MMPQMGGLPPQIMMMIQKMMGGSGGGMPPAGMAPGGMRGGAGMAPPGGGPSMIPPGGGIPPAGMPGNGTDGARPNIDMKLLASLMGGMSSGNQFANPYMKGPDFGAGLAGVGQDMSIMNMIKKIMDRGM